MEELKEFFGKNGIKILKQALDEITDPKNLQKECIMMLLDPEKIKNHLNFKLPLEQEQKIMRLRSKIRWFDCALQEIDKDNSWIDDDEVDEYDEDTKKKAQKYLELYWNKVQKLAKIISFAEYKKKYSVNKFIENLEIRHKGRIRGGSYRMGKIYSVIKVTSSYEDSNHIFHSKLNCNISFHWNEENYLWAELRFEDSQAEVDLELEEQEQLYSHLTVTFKISDKLIKENLKINDWGRAIISKDKNEIKQIKQSLNDCKLKCFLE